MLNKGMLKVPRAQAWCNNPGLLRSPCPEPGLKSPGLVLTRVATTPALPMWHPGGTGEAYMFLFLLFIYLFFFTLAFLPSYPVMQTNVSTNSSLQTATLSGYFWLNAMMPPRPANRSLASVTIRNGVYDSSPHRRLGKRECVCWRRRSWHCYIKWKRPESSPCGMLLAEPLPS